MNLDNLQLFSMLKQRMSWLSERQKVIADNVANADTPGYQAKDLKPLSFKETLARRDNRIGMTATNGGHIQAALPQPQRFRKDESETEATPVSNTVLLEEQMLKSTENVADYRMMTNLYSKHVALIRTALSRGR